MSFERIVQETPMDISLKIIAKELDKRNNQVLKYQRLYEDVLNPIKGKESDMCFDIFAYSDPIVENSYIEYKTGLRFEIPEGYDMLIFPRSSISKYDLVLCNSIGVVDQDYRGEVLCRFKLTQWNKECLPNLYKRGDRIVQARIIPKTEVKLQEESYISTNTIRGQGGFGSTGK